MTRSEKTDVIQELTEKFSNNNFFYLADSSTLTVVQINQFRRKCFEQGVEMRVVKNTLAQKALEASPEEKGFQPLFEALKGPTAVLFSENANAPAKIIKEFRKKHERPLLKAAYVDLDVYLGDDQLDALVALKSKEELIGEIISLLQSPMKNVLGALQSGGNTIAGLVKALGEREE